jgi:hypothetical protein
VWSLKKGTIIRVYKNVSPGDITAITLDDLERKLFLGTHEGAVLYIVGLIFHLLIYNYIII